MSDSPAASAALPSILLVTRNLPPLRGGMERLNQHMALELKQQFRLQVVGPLGCRAALPDSIEVHEIPVHPLWRFLLHALFRGLWSALRHRPRIVLAGSGLTAPIAVLAARMVGGRSVVYAHGLDLAVNHRLYRAVWLPFLRRCDWCLVNSRHTAQLAMKAGLDANRISIIHPGVTLPESTSLSDGADFRRTHGLADSKVLLSVGRLTARKGLLEFVREGLHQVVKSHPEAILLVIGDEAPDALNGVGTGGSGRIMSCARELGLEGHLRMLGACSDDTLSAAYAAADLCIFPLRDIPGDVEGFGMVAIEAAAHGLPTVAFRVGGVVDAIADGRSGWLVPPGNYPMMAERISQVLSAGRSAEVRRQAQDFAEGFDWRHFGSRLRERMSELLVRKVTRQ